MIGLCTGGTARQCHGFLLCIVAFCNVEVGRADFFCKFRDAELKGQKGPRSKKGVHSTPPDLKGSAMKCLQAIEATMVNDLLKGVALGSTSLHELACQCASIKQLAKIQSAYITPANCSSWSEAEEKYPEFVVAEKLEVFKKLNCNKPTIPAEFTHYCQ